MATLLCFGLGYTAKDFIASYHDRFDRVFATVRSDRHAAEFNASDRPWLTVIEFDGKPLSSSIRAAIADADDVIVSVPPDATGDVVLAACGDALSRGSVARLLARPCHRPRSTRGIASVERIKELADVDVRPHKRPLNIR
jgi:hypothetical protein